MGGEGRDAAGRRGEGRRGGVVGGEIEDRGEEGGGLVGTDVGGVAVVELACHEDAGRGVEGGPEGGVYLEGGVEAETVDWCG